MWSHFSSRNCLESSATLNPIVNSKVLKPLFFPRKNISLTPIKFFVSLKGDRPFWEILLETCDAHFTILKALGNYGKRTLFFRLKDSVPGCFVCLFVFLSHAEKYAHTQGNTVLTIPSTHPYLFSFPIFPQALSPLHTLHLTIFTKWEVVVP